MVGGGGFFGMLTDDSVRWVIVTMEYIALGVRQALCDPPSPRALLVLQNHPQIIMHPDHHVAFSIQATLPGAALQQILATHFNAKPVGLKHIDDRSGDRSARRHDLFGRVGHVQGAMLADINDGSTITRDC